MDETFLELVDDLPQLERRFAELYAECVALTDQAHRMPGGNHYRFEGILDTLEYLRGRNDDKPTDRIYITDESFTKRHWADDPRHWGGPTPE